MKTLKKWIYFVSFVIVGILYFTLVDKGQTFVRAYGELGFFEEKATVSPPPDSRIEQDVEPKKDTMPDREGQAEAAITEPEQNNTQSSENSQTQEEQPLILQANQTVTDDYFSDALFIGDSRTVGLFEYGNLEETATFFASTGMSVYKIFDEKVSMNTGHNKVTFNDVINEREYGKVYIMLGINELGVGDAHRFEAKYDELICTIRELQPNAIIYIQGILEVTAQRSAFGDYITNEEIEKRNDALKKLVDYRYVFYLDVNAAICEEDGSMIAKYTTDGVHLKAQYISLWTDYLKTHAVVTE